MKMKKQKWQDIRKRRLSPERVTANDTWVAKALLEMNLRALRELSGKTQVDLSVIADMTQGEISRAETRQDHLVSTLRRIIKALGGELEVYAVFDDKRVRLVGV